jgi:hypothetical protein
VTFDRFGGNRHGFEIGYEANKIDDVQNGRGFWNDHDEVSEISHAVTGKYPPQSSSKTEGE